MITKLTLQRAEQQDDIDDDDDSTAFWHAGAGFKFINQLRIQCTKQYASPSPNDECKHLYWQEINKKKKKKFFKLFIPSIFNLIDFESKRRILTKKKKNFYIFNIVWK